MKELFVCYSYYHVLVSVLKVFDTNSLGDNDIIITDQIPNVELLYKKLNESKIFNSVRFVNDQYRSKIFFASKSIFYKVKFIINYQKYISEMFEDIQIENKNITLYFDRQHLSQYFILNYSNITLSEDGRRSPAAFIFKKKSMRMILENLGLIVKFGGYPDSISSIECSSIDMLPSSLTRKFKEINFQILTQNITLDEKSILGDIFSFKNDCNYNESCVILTQPFFKDNFIDSEEEQMLIYKRIYQTLEDEFESIFIKPHPRDDVDYSSISEEVNILNKNMPFELFNILGIEFKKYVTINSTSISDVNPSKLLVLGGTVDKKLSKMINKYVAESCEPK